MSSVLASPLGVSAELWLEARDARRQAAGFAAEEALAGRSLAPPSLRICGDGPLSAAWFQRWSADEPRPDPDSLGRALGEARLAPGERAPHEHEQAAITSPVDSTPRARLAWAWCQLDSLGERLEADRAAWRAAVWRPDAADGLAREAWRGWLDGDPWALRPEWEDRFLPAVKRSFRAVCRSRNLPDGVQGRVIADLQDAFFPQLLMGAPAGWTDVAARVLETGGGGPVESLARALPAAGWRTLLTCASRRRRWGRTLVAGEPDVVERVTRVRRLAERGPELPELLEAWLDLHVTLRLLDAWRTSGAVVDAWTLAQQNRGRARSRLRAAVAARPEALMGLLALDCLAGRTEAALRRYAWAWAWQELARDFPFSRERPVTPPCVATPLELPALDAQQRSALRTWVLLVILKGRAGHLGRWVGSGSTGDRDSTWARLLKDDLPADLRDPGGGRVAAYHRLRAELAERLDPLLEGLRPTVATVAALSPGRTLRAEVTETLREGWSPAVAFPASGFPTFVRHAAAWLERA